MSPRRPDGLGQRIERRRADLAAITADVQVAHIVGKYKDYIRYTARFLRFVGVFRGKRRIHGDGSNDQCS